MRIVFDFNPVLVNRFSGFYAFGTGLLQGLEGLEEKPEFLLFHSRRFSEQAKFIKEGLGHWAQLRATYVKMRWLENLWQYTNHPKLQHFTGEFDIYHCTHHLMPPTKNKPRILTIYDLRRYKMPELYQKSKLHLFESALKRADHIIAISEATKKDICEVFKIPDEKVDIIYMAASDTFKPVPESEKGKIKKQLSEEIGTQLENYLVVFSSPDKRKNIPRIIEAFLLAQGHLPDNFKLVVVGNLPNDNEIFKSITFSGAANNVIITGPVEKIQNLLCGAKGLVFASLYEGFGIPILEAFACGVPVITSGCSSMPEVAGDAALYVEPYSVDSIAQAIVKVCVEVETRERLINSGLRRHQEFSWQKTAEKTVKVYKKFL
jgi:glycosyltransferase involved in cell wall biosynthesis